MLWLSPWPITSDWFRSEMRDLYVRDCTVAPSRASPQTLVITRTRNHMHVPSHPASGLHPSVLSESLPLVFWFQQLLATSASGSAIPFCFIHFSFVIGCYYSPDSRVMPVLRFWLHISHIVYETTTQMQSDHTDTFHCCSQTFIGPSMKCKLTISRRQCFAQLKKRLLAPISHTPCALSHAFCTVTPHARPVRTVFSLGETGGPVLE